MVLVASNIGTQWVCLTVQLKVLDSTLAERGLRWAVNDWLDLVVVYCFDDLVISCQTVPARTSVEIMRTCMNMRRIAVLLLLAGGRQGLDLDLM